MSTAKINVYGGIYARDVGGGWTRYVHINGGIYFYHSQHRIVTDNDMSDLRWRHVVEGAWRDYRQDCEEDGTIEYVAEDADMVVRYYLRVWSNGSMPGPEDPPEVYFVSHKEGMKASLSRDSTGLRIESSTYDYWTQVEEYPMHLDPNHVLPRARASFLESMTYLMHERIFESQECFMPLTTGQVERFTEIYNDLSGACETNPKVAHILLWFLGRAIREVKGIQEGFAMAYPHYGDGMAGYGMKRYEGSSQCYKGWRLTLAEWLVGWLFLGSHYSYRVRLQNTRWGQGVYLEGFRDMLGAFLEEWSSSNLLAAVFVGANVTFLAVPGVSSLARTSCIASTALCLLSIGSGVYHVWHHRAKLGVDSLEAAKYAYHVQGREGRGFEDLSDPIIMSFFLAIPVAAMMWALLCFLFAVAVFSIQCNMDSKPALVLLGAILCIACLTSGATVAHCKRSDVLPKRGSAHLDQERRPP